MLNYSEEGLSVRPAFFEPYNDVTVIVEDITKEVFYTAIFQKLFADRLRIGRVLAVGGKWAVLGRLLNYHTVGDSRLEFYLVDGDFDELLGIESPGALHFYRLNRYDIESFLLEESAICTIAQEEMPTKSLNEYVCQLRVGPWLNEVESASRHLVACCAVLQELDERSSTLSQSIERYMEGASVVPRQDLIDGAIQQIKLEQQKVDEADFDSRLTEMVERMSEPANGLTRWISGKNILIPLLIRLFRKEIGRNLPKDSLCFRLAKYCEFNTLASLRERILLLSKVGRPQF